jgi:SAM-dependent methyltransferase
MSIVEDAAINGAGRLVNVACPVCLSPDSKFLFDAQDWTLHVSNDRFGVRRCRRCGTGYLSPRPSVADLPKYYPARFYWSYERGNTSIPWGEIVIRRGPQLKAKSRVLSDMEPGRLLDIGAQKGEFLWFMKRQGWEIEGVELDNSVPNPAALPIRYGDFLAMEFEPGSFDVVTIWAVLEHVQEPRLFVEKAASLLRPGGRLVALVTNLNSIQGRFFRADDFPRHLTLFTKKSVRDLARHCGLTVTRIWTDQAIFSGALNGGLVCLAKRLGGYSADEVFNEWKQLEDPLRFWSKWRGKPSQFVLNLSRFDRAVTWFPERLLDALGFGFIMTFMLHKARYPRQ